MRLSLFIAIVVLFSFPQNLYARRASLKGSVLSQKRQNRTANHHNLSRLRNLKEVKKFVRLHFLTPITDTQAYFLSPHLGGQDRDNASWYRHARPWTKRFLDKELGEGHRITGERFKLTSLVRTNIYQCRLTRKNVNAISGCVWWKKSSHLTGATVDISYKNMSREARRWLEKRLLKLERRGLIEATKELRSYCFHIMVFPEYERVMRGPNIR